MNTEMAMNSIVLDEKKMEQRLTYKNEDYVNIHSKNNGETDQEDKVIQTSDSAGHNTSEKKDETDVGSNFTSEKKSKRPASISLKEKSETFKRIIDIALEYEKADEERKKLREKVRLLSEEGKKIADDLAEIEKAVEEKNKEINDLKTDVEHRDEVIDIVKADKIESSKDYKMALASELKIYYDDYIQLKNIEMSDDIGYALIDTLESVFNVLSKNNICIG